MYHKNKIASLILKSFLKSHSFFALKAQSDGSQWQDRGKRSQPLVRNIEKSRPEGTLRFFASLQDARSWITDTRRFTSGYHLSAALRQTGLSKRLLAFTMIFGALMIATNLPQFAQAFAQENPKLKNSEPKTPESIEAGKKSYQRHCASCHGKGGKGDGGMALSGGTPKDLTDEKWDYGASDGEIFTSIREGVSADMLEYKNKLDDKQIWQIVNFIRSIGPNTAKEK